MKQTIKGAFDLTLRGLPFLFTGVLRLTSEKGNGVEGKGIFIGPFGLVKVGRRFEASTPQYPPYTSDDFAPVDGI